MARSGMTGRSQATYIVVSDEGEQDGPTYVGPFDGRSPATAFAREMRRAGVVAREVALHTPESAREWAKRYAPKAEEEYCNSCGAPGQLFSGWFGKDDLASDGLQPGDRWRTYCTRCGTWQES